MKNSILIFLLLFSGYSVSAQIFPVFGGQRAGLSTLTFLKNDLSPRSIAMGGASVALNGDGFSYLTNPAALVDLKSFNISASNMFLGAGIQQTFLGANYATKNRSSFGVSINNLNSGAIDVRTEFQPNGTGEIVYANNLAFGLTYSKSLSDMFSMGVTMKYINEVMAQYRNHTVAADLGFLYNTDFRDLKFAVEVHNFGAGSGLRGNYLAVNYNRTQNAAPEKYTVPTVFRMGLSINVFKKEKHCILAAVQLEHPNDNAENYRLGFEYAFQTLLFVRSGIKINVAGQKAPTFGFGIRSRVGGHPLVVHYAANPSNILGTQHLLGLSFTFQKATRE
jgi:hypothetical protein